MQNTLAATSMLRRLFHIRYRLYLQRQAKEREKGEKGEKGKERKGKERERKEKGKRKEWRVMHGCQRIQRRAREDKGRQGEGKEEGSVCACVRAVCVRALSFTWTYLCRM